MVKARSMKTGGVLKFAKGGKKYTSTSYVAPVKQNIPQVETKTQTI
jgi:hypothetical protein